MAKMLILFLCLLPLIAVLVNSTVDDSKRSTFTCQIYKADMTISPSVDLTKKCCSKGKGTCEYVAFKKKARSVCMAKSLVEEKKLFTAMGECCSRSNSEVSQQPLAPYKLRAKC